MNKRNRVKKVSSEADTRSVSSVKAKPLLFFVSDGEIWQRMVLPKQKIWCWWCLKGHINQPFDPVQELQLEQSDTLHQLHWHIWWPPLDWSHFVFTLSAGGRWTTVGVTLALSRSVAEMDTAQLLLLWLRYPYRVDCLWFPGLGCTCWMEVLV